MKVLILLLAVAIQLPLLSQDTSKNQTSHIEITDFKRLLDEGKIVSVKAGKYGSLSGQYKNIEGEVVSFEVGYVSDFNIFLVDILREKNIPFGYSLEEKGDDEFRGFWAGLAFIIIIASIFVSQIFIIIYIRKLKQSLSELGQSVAD